LVRRGEIWLVRLDPTVGTEIQKTRPCLVISPDELNRKLATYMIVPLTTGSHPARFRTPIRFRKKDGLVLNEQIRTVARQRLVTRLGQAEPATLTAVLSLLRSMFDE
jgi:mRNA interferase MazF